MDGISVIICCYNSAKLLPETLHHIALQHVPEGMQWEVIIVNNSSTDNTSEVAGKEWAKYNCSISFIIVDEPALGLSNARNKGIKTAKFEFLLFCDDDNWLESNYISTCYKIMNEKKDIGIVGGWSDAVSDIAFPSWFYTYQGWYAVGVQALNEGDVSKRRFIWGASMCLRKSIFDVANNLGFDLFLSDRTGSSLASGGDSEISEWARLLGFKLYYSEQLHYTHFIPHYRLTKDYLKQLQSESYICDYWLSKYDLLLGVKELKRSQKKNLIKGIKLYLKSKIPLSCQNNNSLTIAQFMVGSRFKISTYDDYRFIKVFEKVIYLR